MVVYTDNRVYVFFAECADQIVCTFLHFRIGTLDSVQFDTIRISACIYAGNRTTTETYTIVVTTYDNNLVALSEVLSSNSRVLFRSLRRRQA
jgi:hypothetical protein